MKDNRNNKAKIYMIFSLVVLVIAVIVSGTYAYYVWTTSDSDTTKIVAGIGAATVTFDGGSDISANLRPVSDKSKGIVKNINVKGDTEGLVFNMYLDITSIDTGLKDESFRYELYKGTTKVKEGNFSDSYLTSNTVTCTKNNTNHIVLLTNESISTSKTSYTLYIWIDGANYTNPNTMMNKTFSFKLHADGEEAVLKKTAAQTITELYTTASKTTVTNNSITYNTAPSVSLMNDRLGGTISATVEGKAWQSTAAQEQLNNPKSENECLNNFNNYYNCSTNYTKLGFDNQTDCEKLFTEDSLNEGRQELCSKSIGELPDDTAGGNIRYYGANPNNYIYFNCSDYNNQTSSTCETWRIIGVFDNKLKLIRGSEIGTYAWDNKNTSTGAETDYGKNDWTTARLMKLLNPSKYYTIDSNDNNLGQSLYYNNISGKCYFGSNNITEDCDFTNTGIKNDTTRNMIAETTYYLGGWNSSSVYPNQIYGYERGTTVYSGRSTTWQGKIALTYPSDYGYAVDFNMCNKSLYNYNDTTCASNNWIKSIITWSFLWLLTSNSRDAYEVWYITSSGIVVPQDRSSSYSSYGVVPVLYLNSELKIGPGDGTSSNPYQLSV